VVGRIGVLALVAFRISEHDRSIDGVVAFPEHGRSDRNGFPNHSFGRISAALDHR
jgi:hypothetical protein